MSIFQETVTFEHESEHVLEHDLSAKSNFFSLIQAITRNKV